MSFEGAEPIPLVSGWSFIGVARDPSLPPTKPQDYLASIDDLWVTMAGYDTGSAAWEAVVAPGRDPAAVDELTDVAGGSTSIESIERELLRIETGRAYWVYVIEATALQP